MGRHTKISSDKIQTDKTIWGKNIDAKYGETQHSPLQKLAKSCFF